MDLEARLVNEIIESKPFANSTRIESSARFSPDSNRIAFVSHRSGGPEIWVAGRDGSGLQQITSLEATQLLISGWSPDGANIVFDAAIAGNSDVYVIGSDGGSLRRLTSEPSTDGIPSWSADGRWIYFSSTRAGVIPDVWRISAEGGTATRITRNGGFDPKESPDGQFLFYLDRYPGMGGTAKLMRALVDGGQENVVLEHIRPFLWSVTEKAILFVTRESDFDALDIDRVSDQRVARVGRLGFRIPGIYTHMTVSRNGRWALATEMVRFDSDLMRLDNFR
jgi:Tol biopolymer transport system component